MPLVAELVTELKVNDLSFRNAMTGATAAFAVFSAAAIGVYKAVDSITDRIDVMAKSADRLGISLANFQGLAYAARIGNTSVETLEQGMIKLAKAVDKSATSNDNGTDAFARLGLSAKLLQSLSLDEQYLRVAEAMSKVGNNSEQIALSMELFGKGGAQQLTAMRENLRGLSEEYNKLGLTITTQQAAAADAFQDSKTRLQSIIGGFADQVGAELATPFSEIITSITNTITRTGDLREAAKIVASGVVGSFKFMVDSIGVFLTALDNTIDKFTYLKNLAIDAQNRFAMVGRAIVSGTVDPSVIGTPDDGKVRSKPSNLAQGTSDFAELLRKADSQIFAPLKLSALDVSSSIKKVGSTMDGLAESTQKLHAVQDLLNSAGKAETDRLLRNATSGANSRPQAVNAQFEALLADIIRNPGNANKVTGLTRTGGDAENGTYTGNTQLQQLTAIMNDIKKNTSLSTSGMQGALDELNTYIKDVGQTVAKPAQVDLNINIKASKEFEAETERKMDARSKRVLDNYINQLSRQQGRRGI